MTQDPGSGSPMSERMQSLLSRAVEDQLTEQRQLAGALTDVHAQLTRLADRLDALQSTAGAAGPAGAGAELTAELREAVRLLGERIDRVADGISAGLERAEAHDTALRELRQAFTGMAARVAQLPAREDIDTALGRLAAQIDASAASSAGQSAPAGSTFSGEGADVESAVARAVADSEQRLTAHIDEAVLALAEALLRRRTRTAARSVPSVAPPVVSPSPPLLDDDVEGYDADDDEVDAITEFSVPAPTLFDRDDAVVEAGGDREAAEPTTEAGPPADSDPADGAAGEADSARKRKPWWRPGG